MGVSYRPDNPFAPKKTYRPDNPFAPKEDAPAEESSPKGAFLAPLAQGATLGFADEILGGIHAVNAFLPKAVGGEGLPLQRERSLSDLITGGTGRGGLEGFKEKYEEGRDRVRRGTEQFAKANPKTALGLEVAGGLGSAAALPGGMLGKGAESILKRLGVGALEGAAIGGVAGAGTADDGLADRLAGAGKGAVFGGVVGAAAPAIAETAKSTAGLVRNLVGRRGTAASRHADALLSRALTRDNVTPADLATRAGEVAGKPAILPDIAGENVLGLARGAQATPSTAKETLAEMLTRRQAEQSGRVADDVESALNVRRGNVFQTADDLARTRQEHAGPLYQAAFQHGAVDNPRINELLKLPYFQKAWEQAKRLAALDEKTLPEIMETTATPTDVSTLGPQLQAQGIDPVQFQAMVKAGKIPQIPASTEKQVARQVPTVEALHYLKLGLDDVISKGLGEPLESGGLSKTAAAKVLGKQREFLSLLDKEVPAYAKARDVYAGDTRMMEALEQGRQFSKTRPELVERQMQDMGAAEREMYKAGVIDDIRSAMDQTDGDVVKRIFGNPEKRARLKAVFGDAFPALEQKMAQESRMARTKSVVLGGSPTARIGSELQELGQGGAADWAATLARSGKAGVVNRALAAIVQRAHGNAGEVADELSKRMAIAPNTPEFTQLLDAIQRIQSPPVRTVRALPGPTVRRALSAGAGAQ